MNVATNIADRYEELRERAKRVIPGGMWGHMNAARLPPEYPQYFAKAEGARIWDVNGREYVDFMCAWGPMVLGYRDPDVEAAVRAQGALGDSLNGPSERLVELAELLNETIPHCDWSMLAKNGTDATTIALTIARAATEKRKVLIARKAYHGAAPWCTPYPAGTLPEDRAHQIFYDYNDPQSLEQAVAEAGEDLARHHRPRPSATTSAATMRCPTESSPRRRAESPTRRAPL